MKGVVMSFIKRARNFLRNKQHPLKHICECGEEMVEVSSDKLDINLWFCKSCREYREVYNDN